METFDTVIIGGGPAGSACALYLRSMDEEVCVIEKSAFPRETVCGEFLSNEVSMCLKELGLFDAFLEASPNEIGALRIHSELGQTVHARLGFPAFAMKRGAFDRLLLERARRQGAFVLQPAEVTEIIPKDDRYMVRITDASGPHACMARRLVGAYGRHSMLDKQLGRRFVSERSHLNGIKLHVDRALCPALDTGAIHLFTGSHLYCGVNAVNSGAVTVCFLEKRQPDDEPPRRQLARLAAGNRAFRESFTDAFEESCAHAPLYGTGNIFFGRKEPVVDGIFMAGDAADVIAPLAGDGIGIAMQGGRLLAEVLYAQRRHGLARRAAEALYRQRKAELFRKRIRIARIIQTILLSPPLCTIGLSAAEAIPGLLPRIVALTRGFETHDRLRA